MPRATNRRIVDLGFPCPACNSERGFTRTDMWNCWKCRDCLTVSTIRDSVIEIVPSPSGGRTEQDSALDEQEQVKELDWCFQNRAFCNFIHRKVTV